jgi:hypothetical protein
MSATAQKQAPSPRRQRAQVISRADEAQDGFSGQMPQEARDGLERALCRVLERRHPRKVA